MKTNVWRRETSPEEKIKTGGTVLVMVGCYTMSLSYKKHGWGSLVFNTYWDVREPRPIRSKSFKN
jgi:carbohydrate-binding DOMON domain-containing protein